MLRQGKFNFHSGVIKWSFKKKERKQTDKEGEYCTRCKSNFQQVWIILSDFNISKNSKKKESCRHFYDFQKSHQQSDNTEQSFGKVGKVH